MRNNIKHNVYRKNEIIEFGKTDDFSTYCLIPIR